MQDFGKFKTMIQYFLVTVFALLELVYLWTWGICTHFQNRFHFSSLDLKLRINEAVGQDKGIPLFITRLFHNKIIGIYFDTFKYFIEYFDIRFITALLSLAGMISFFYGIFALFKSGDKRLTFLIFTLLFIVSFVEIFLNPPIPFNYKIVLLALPYQFISLYGIWKFSQTDKRPIYIVGILGLLILSIAWLILIQKDLTYYCVTV